MFTAVRLRLGTLPTWTVAPAEGRDETGVRPVIFLTVLKLNPDVSNCEDVQTVEFIYFVFTRMPG